VYNAGVPDEKFTVTIQKEGAASAQSIATFFKQSEPVIEKWTFSWYEDLFAQDAKQASVVNVASKIYRRVALYEPGNYVVTLSAYGGAKKTTAIWTVRPLAAQKKAKNVILFIGWLLPFCKTREHGTDIVYR
jgi:hypothetical protein